MPGHGVKLSGRRNTASAAVTFALAAVVVVGVTAALRIVPGLLWPFRGMDAGAHFLIRRQIRRNGMRMSMRGWPLLLDQRQTYPWVFHWLLALLPESWLRRCPPLASAICDALHVLIVMLLAAALAPRIAPDLDPVVMSLLAGLLVATAPALLVVGVGPRAYEVTPRPFGELLFTATMASALWYVHEGHAVAAIAAVVACGLLLLSSKFAAQVLLFCTPIVAAVAGELRLLLLLPLGVAAALVLSGGGYWWVARAQCIHLLFYRRRLQYEHPALRSRNRGRELLHAAARTVRHPMDRDARIALVRLAEGHTFLQFLLRNVLWCVTCTLIALAVFPGWPGAVEEWRIALIAWGAAPVAPFLLSSLRDYRFLGEAERYPEYGLAPIAIVASAGVLGVGAPAGGWLLFAYALTLVPAIGYTISRLRWNYRLLNQEAIDGLTAHLRTLPAGSVIIALPWHLAFQVMIDLEHRWVAALDPMRWVRDYDRIFMKYPWMAPDLSAWRREFDADYVIVDGHELEKSGVTYPLDQLEVAFRNSRFRVYRWPSGAGAGAP